MAEAGNSDGTRFNRYDGLKAFLRWAVAEGLLAANPRTTIPAPRPRPRRCPSEGGSLGNCHRQPNLG